MNKQDEQPTVSNPPEHVVSCEFLKNIKNKVVSTTGDSITDKSICLIVYLYEQHKISINSN